MMLYNLVVG